MADNADPLIGQTLGGLYDIVAQIGVGGMGTVYEARHVHLDKLFAVKVLHRHKLGDPSRRQRFLSEARAASHVDHPNIVNVTNFDIDESGRVFIVMEHLKGQSLATMLKNGPLQQANAIAIATQIADALGAAHHQGIVHRDLKPENVFVCEGQPLVCKVLDFGISKFVGDDVKLTATDEIVGTPMYISPEQVTGETEPDHRVDIYALAAITYEMLTGQPPFTGDNRFQLLYKHGHEAPIPPSVRNETIAPHVEQAILRGLHKEPNARFESMAAFKSALLGDTEPTQKRRASRWPAVLIAAALAAGVVWWSSKGPNADPVAVPDPVANPNTVTDSNSNADTDSVPDTDSGTGAGTGTGAGADTGAVTGAVTVQLTSSPPGAAITLDGEPTSHRTPANIDLPTNADVVIRFSKPGYLPTQRLVSPKEQQSLSLRLKRKPKPKIKLDF